MIYTGKTTQIEMLTYLATNQHYVRESEIFDLSIEERIKYLTDNFSDEDIIQEYKEMIKP